MRLQHPSGTIWPADYGGGNILDALGEFIVRKEPDYYASRSRGHKPHPDLPDRNVSIDESGNSVRADITTLDRRRVRL
jgi:hypothetical protein